MNLNTNPNQTASGFLLVDKPAGITSHDVIQVLRRKTGVRRIGHAGTLDPFATGLLIVGVGREATRQLSLFSGQDKEYLATMRLGAVSTTQDLDGEITESSGNLPKKEQLLAAMQDFRGEIEQIPPMFSAKKIAGQRLYKLARAGQEVERPPVNINVETLELVSYEPPLARIRVVCSSGTYIRTLAHDIGQACGCGAYLTELRRTTIGSAKIEASSQLMQIEAKN